MRKNQWEGEIRVSVRNPNHDLGFTSAKSVASLTSLDPMMFPLRGESDPMPFHAGFALGVPLSQPINTSPPSPITLVRWRHREEQGITREKREGRKEKAESSYFRGVHRDSNDLTRHYFLRS